VRLDLIASGGWIPTSDRETCCLLARDGDHALIIDAGTGIARLVERPDLLEGVRRLDILLTHFHLDHVIGLAYLPGLALEARPGLFGPGAELYGRPTEEILGRLIGPPLFGAEVGDLLESCGELREGAQQLDGFAITCRAQRRHPDPTLAIRLADELAYCTDTAFDEGNIEFARGARVLAHEAWCTEDQPADKAGHSSAREAATIALRAGVRSLVLIHVNPLGDPAALESEAAAVVDEVAVGTDLMRL
jgi:ribonuclease BN (tRNA processing enzyme)